MKNLKWTAILLATLAINSAYADMPAMRKAVFRGEKAEKVFEQGRKSEEAIDCDGVMIEIRKTHRAQCADRLPLMQNQDAGIESRFKCVGMESLGYNWRDENFWRSFKNSIHDLFTSGNFCRP